MRRSEVYWLISQVQEFQSKLSTNSRPYEQGFLRLHRQIAMPRDLDIHLLTTKLISYTSLLRLALKHARHTS
jgi:hypothetical protein